MPLSSAQVQNSTPTHNHTTASFVDGSIHPELIPDVTAYRLVLLSLSKPPNPTGAQAQHQCTQLRGIGLRIPDQSALVSMLAQFNSQYRSLIQSYNAAATAANARGERADINGFLLQRNQFVQAIHDQLKSTMSADGWTHFNAQDQKRHMKIGPGEVK